MSFNERQYDEYVWEFKYRPKSIEDMVLPPRLKDLLQKQVESGDLNNFMFDGPPGAGKTTAAFCLADQTGRETKYFDLSTQRGVSVVESEFHDFLSSVSFDGQKKLIIGDEFDRLSPTAQDSLKGTTEKFTKAANFIFITNHADLIKPAVKSRLSIVNFSFTKDERKEMKKNFFAIMKKILAEEGVEYDPKAVAKIINTSYPDFRNTIKTAQTVFTSFGEIAMEGVESYTANTGVFFDLVAEQSFPKMRQYIADISVDYKVFMKQLFVEAIKRYSGEKLSEVLKLIEHYEFRTSFSVDGSIQLTTLALELFSLEEEAE